MKGISAVIATILLLMITIAIASTAYMYVTGMIGGMTSKTISVSHASCDGGAITLVISNDGTTALVDGDLKVYVNNGDVTGQFGALDDNVQPHTTSVATGSGGNSGSVTVLIVSPSNSASQTVYC